MKTKTKASGFFIVEILIVLLIVGILAIALMPNLSTYVKKAKFADDIAAAEGLKSAVEFCLVNNVSGTTVSTLCDSGTQGIPTAITTNYGGNVKSAAVTDGVIYIVGTSSVDSATYQLTPVISANGVITWSNTASGTDSCSALGLC